MAIPVLARGGPGSDASGPPAAAPAAPLVFSDRFVGHRLDRTRWNTYLTDAASSGLPWNTNGKGGSSPARPPVESDLEYDLPSQVRVDGALRIVARRLPTPGFVATSPYTFPWRSGAVSTYGKFEFDGGYLEVVARMPTAPGMWPSVFLLPGASVAGSLRADEIDLFEGGYLGAGPPPDNYSWHLHTDVGSAGGVTDVGTDLSAGFHAYGLEWIPGKRITWYFDGHEVGQVTSAQLPIPVEPMELIVDLQVAGPATTSYHSLTGASTPPRATMTVRRVAVYSFAG